MSAEPVTADGDAWLEPRYGLRSSRCSCDDPHEGQKCWPAPERVLEVRISGQCSDSPPVTALGEKLADKPAAAGIAPDDPGLRRWRQWNAAAFGMGSQ